MKNPSGSVSRLTTPIKAWAQRFAFLFLVVGAFALMLLGKADTLLVERIRTAVGDAAAPILEFIARPIDSISGAVEGIGKLADLRARNVFLERENERLRHWQAVARQLEAENTALRSLTDMAPDRRVRFVTARVVGDQGGAFARSVLVNAGNRDGVAKGQAAITSEGLAGRVVEVGVRSARVLLVTDINSRIPVLVGERRDRAILAGDNTNQPRLRYLAPGTEIRPGDHVVTSGHGAIFPPGLPIGVVTQASETTMRVQPFVDWAHMEFLRLADYELPGTLLPAQGAAARRSGRR
ncbi:MAG: rod shape-determining protein MreC, partial [Proteobacteria bacterium]|nr:rod shape-determining protein MreC [Pseudomonadota bacterium]